MLCVVAVFAAVCKGVCCLLLRVCDSRTHAVRVVCCSVCCCVRRRVLSVAVYVIIGYMLCVLFVAACAAVYVGVRCLLLCV